MPVDGLSLTKMLMLSSDGPNVNIALERKLNADILALGGSPLADIGTCNLHVAHKASRAGLREVCSWNIDEFLTDVFYWFKNYPARREDYESLFNAVTDKEISCDFIRFVESRGLSIGPVIDRILQQWSCLCDFFLKGKFSSSTTDNAQYKRICSQLTDNKATLVRLNTVRTLCAEFERFLTLFQESVLSIHLLRDKITELLRRLLRRFVKDEMIQGKSARQLVEIKFTTENCLPSASIDVGTEARKLLTEMKTEKSLYGTYRTLCLDIKTLLETTAANVMKIMPLSNVLLKNLCWLSPLIRQQPQTVQMMSAIIDGIPDHLPNGFKDNVLQE